MISSEVRELLSKGTVIETTPSPGSFVSQIFLVEKKEGGQRPVINLRALNMYIKHEHFIMEGLPDLIQSEDWMIKLDLKDAYLQVPIRAELFKALGLVINQKKSRLTPHQNMEFLGFQVDTVSLQLIFPAKKLRKMQQLAQHLLHQPRVLVRDLVKFVGRPQLPHGLYGKFRAL